MTPQQFQHNSRSLRKTFLLIFSSLLIVVVSLVFLFIFLYQQQLNSYFLTSINDSTILLDKSISLHRQQLEQEFESVSVAVLQAHRKAAAELQKDKRLDLVLITELKESIEVEFGFSVEINLIDEEGKIFRSTFPSEVGVDLSQFPDACESLIDVRLHGCVRLDLPIFEPSSRFFRAYTLSHIKKLGCFLQLAVKLTEYNKFFAILQEIKESSATIVAIDLFVVEQNHQGKSYIASFTQSGEKISESEKKIVLDVVKKTGMTIGFPQNKGDVRDYYRVVNSVLHSPGWYHNLEYNLVYRFRLDMSAWHHFVWSSILLAGVFILLTCGGMVAGWGYLQRRLTVPLMKVVANIQDSVLIPDADIDESVKELAIISHTYNQHILKITQSAEEFYEKNIQLQASLDEIRTLSGLLPMCANCHKIRDDQGYWTRVEHYMSEHLDVDFTHGICPDCVKELYPNVHAKRMARKNDVS
jgi:hypothetical protein